VSANRGEKPTAGAEKEVDTGITGGRSESEEHPSAWCEGLKAGTMPYRVRQGDASSLTREEGRTRGGEKEKKRKSDAGTSK